LVTDHVWTIAELIGLLESAEAASTKRGPYRKTRAKRSYPEEGVIAGEISN